MKGERKWKKEFLSSYSQALTKSTLRERSKKLKKNGCPEGEDLLTLFGKLVSAEIVSDALRIDDNEGNN